VRVGLEGRHERVFPPYLEIPGNRAQVTHAPRTVVAEFLFPWARDAGKEADLASGSHHVSDRAPGERAGQRGYKRDPQVSACASVRRSYWAA
jgi:hypothetical protein